MRVRLRDLTLLDKNARYMPPEQFKRLVANLRRDGCLTSAPTIYRKDDKALVLSGNHRVQAAIEAGIEEADAIEIVTPLTDQQLVAIQLSHNAIVGKDDPNTLRELYQVLDFDLKEYTGLTDDMFKVEDLDTSVLRVEKPLYQEIHIAFLPADKDAFAAYMQAITKAMESKKVQPERCLAHADDFEKFFDALVAVKELRGVTNSAVALRIMAELAVQKLGEMSDGDAGSEA